MSLTGYLLNNGTDLSNVFMNINNGALLVSQNSLQAKQTFAGGVDVSGSFLYGRNDRSAFDLSFNQTYPIGYTNTQSFLSQSITVATATQFAPTLKMSTGVWLVYIYLEVVSGVTGWGTVGYVQIFLPTPNSNPADSFKVFDNGIVQSMTGSTLLVPIIISQMTIVVKTPATMFFSIIINCSGSPIIANIRCGMTKIA